jgi:hypothetical protein
MLVLRKNSFSGGLLAARAVAPTAARIATPSETFLRPALIGWLESENSWQILGNLGRKSRKSGPSRRNRDGPERAERLSIAWLFRVGICVALRDSPSPGSTPGRGTNLAKTRCNCCVFSKTMIVTRRFVPNLCQSWRDFGGSRRQ